MRLLGGFKLLIFPFPLKHAEAIAGTNNGKIIP